jgi:hypothetical protein
LNWRRGEFVEKSQFFYISFHPKLTELCKCSPFCVKISVNFTFPCWPSYKTACEYFLGLAKGPIWFIFIFAYVAQGMNFLSFFLIIFFIVLCSCSHNSMRREKRQKECQYMYIESEEVERENRNANFLLN